LFIDADIIDDKKELLVKKCSLYDLNESFDIIMLNHALEHMPDNVQALKHIHTLLNDGGSCMVSIPTVSSWLWKKYKENWYNLDAPRHFYLHSLASIDIMADKCGFKVDRIKYNTDYYSIKRSKRNSKGIYTDNPANGSYTPAWLFEFGASTIIAKYLNIIRKADKITIYLSKQPQPRHGEGE
jgi:SAM-dependent methyltransferase